jgi:phenylacetate-CoA ligase
MERKSGFLNEALETKSWEAQREELAGRLRKIVAHAYAHAPAVRTVFRESGIEPEVIRSLDDLPLIPVTPKAKLVEMQAADPPFGGLLAVPFSQVRRIFRSPGPIYDPQGFQEGWGWEEALFAAGFRPGDICINTFGYHMTPAGMMFDDALSALGCPVVPTGVGERESQLDIMRALRVRGFVGMASFLLQIGEKAREQGLDPQSDLCLQVAFVTAEPLPESLRAAVEGLFGLTLRQGFGTADCGCLAYECFHKGGMHVVNRAIVEVVDPTTGRPMASGETGEVVVTLFNEAYPLLRFGTGDLSALDEGECACGRKTPKLRGWLGRADQLVKVKGMFIHPGQIQAAIKEFPEVTRFRVIVTREANRDAVTLRAEAAPPSDELKAQLEHRLREVLRVGTTVTWAEAGSLPSDGKAIEDARKWE